MEHARKLKDAIDKGMQVAGLANTPENRAAVLRGAHDKLINVLPPSPDLNLFLLLIEKEASDLEALHD